MWSPDGKQIFFAARGAAIRGSIARTPTARTRSIYRYDPGAVNCADISADGKHLLFNSGGVILVGR